MKRELNLSPSPPSILLGTFMPLFHWLRDPLKPASVLKLFFFFFFDRNILPDRDKKRLEKYIKRLDTRGEGEEQREARSSNR